MLGLPGRKTTSPDLEGAGQAGVIPLGKYTEGHEGGLGKHSRLQLF